VRRLVEDDHLVLAQQRLRETQALEVALRELLDALASLLVQPHELDGVRDTRLELVSRNAREDRVSLERFLELPTWRNRDQLGQIADAVLLDESARLHGRDADTSVGGLEVTQQQRYERAFAGTVRAGESENLALADGEREALDRANAAAEERAICVADFPEFDQRGIAGGIMPGAARPPP